MSVLRGELIRVNLDPVACCGQRSRPSWSPPSSPGVLAIVGPENANPPMPGIDTAEGAGLILGLSTVTLFIPALIGTVAVTGEYRHRTTRDDLLGRSARAAGAGR